MSLSIIEKYCCGCGLCSGSVTCKENDSGYFRPDLSCEHKDFDFSVCYCNHLESNVENGLWGKYEKLYYGYAKDSIIRNRAASGGMLTSIALYLLQSKIVDAVIQVSPKKEDYLKTEVVVNKIEDDVVNCAGSRYTASAVLLGFWEKIEKDKKYAVVGKPCDISVLRAYLNKHPEINAQIVCLLSFFCGGTPSFQANENLLNSMNVKRENVRSFTYRGNGWPGETVCIDHTGEKHCTQYEESWGKILGRDLQEICRFCWEGVGESADISCGDGWYLVDSKPSFQENEGRNVVIARSKIGMDILTQMSDADLIDLKEIENEEELLLMQPGQLMRKAAMFSRVLAMKLLRKEVPHYRMGKILPYAKYLTFEHNLRMFGGTVRRILNGKIK